MHICDELLFFLSLNQTLTGNALEQSAVEKVTSLSDNKLADLFKVSKTSTIQNKHLKHEEGPRNFH